MSLWAFSQVIASVENTICYRRGRHTLFETVTDGIVY